MALSFIKYLLCCQETFPCLLLSDAVNTSPFMWTHSWLNVENFGWSVTPDSKHILDMWPSLQSTGPCSLTLIRFYMSCLSKSVPSWFAPPQFCVFLPCVVWWAMAHHSVLVTTNLAGDGPNSLGKKKKKIAVVVATKTVGFMLKNDTRLAACNFILSNSWCKSQVNLWLWYGTLRINVNMDTHKLCQHMSWWLGWITTQERNEAHLASASRKWSNISNYFQGLPNINQ